MDPDANLEEQLFWAKRIQQEYDLPTYWRKDDFVNNAARLAELVLALNDWVQKGGALPKKWTHE